VVNKNSRDSRGLFFAYSILLEFQTEQEVTCNAMGFETIKSDDGAVGIFIDANVGVQDAPNAMLAR